MSTPTISIRPAHPGDFHQLRGLLIRSYIEYHDCLAAAAFAAYLADLVDLERRFDLGEILVAEHDRAIVGTATFYADATDDGAGWPAGASSLRAVAVRPATRGLGVGRALLEACVDRARQRGSVQLCLHTAPFMTGASRLYEAAGFERAPDFDVDLARRIPGSAAGVLVVSAFALEMTGRAAAA